MLQRGIAALYVVAFVSTLNQFRPASRRARAASRDRAARLGALLEARAAAAASDPVPPRAVHRPAARRAVRGGHRGRRGAGARHPAARPAVGADAVLPRAVARLHVDHRASARPSTASAGRCCCSRRDSSRRSSARTPSRRPTVVIVLFWWLVFRLEFGAGMIKIRGGREWRDLTALMYHHETQPMPGPLSRQAHLLPRWFHRGRGRRQPLRAARRAVVPVRAAARPLGARSGAGDRRRGRGRDRHRDPAVAHRHRQLRLAQLGHGRARAFSAIGVPGIGAPARRPRIDPPGSSTASRCPGSS